ncbi:MAG: HAD-IA family hydrolase [Chitinophagaceae bacterium]
MIRMAIFDMAGTTVNENNLVYKAVREAVNLYGFDFTLDEVLAEAAGREKLQGIKSVLALKGVRDEKLAGEIFEKFRQLLDETYRTQPVSEQANAGLLFHELRQKGILVVLNTGYNRETAETLIEKIGWRPDIDFDGLVTASDVNENRPQPDMIRLAMQQFGITDALEVLKIGDSVIDIEEGRNAGCRFCIGITTGAHTRYQLQSASPDFIVDNLIELLPVIDQENKG